ncbi:putative CECR1 family adenosine deaminase [Aspergillus saccharolyticus JOP 1030-1]|uniref:adenosine deaminase n=1 Tax=Aspergillus saccharolyticus JOP 1030-1 TaxID=1450539 RepID=A0A318ZH57_9EURO|nr:putative CECR1 family adenosine deaminase [Aspergillus saccharolyticus JOP 1030-1]PYH46896.1 putative CECR1 family adenosine deaminase [Aspergillus saccharolyticus JOP 1030-1]
MTTNDKEWELEQGIPQLEDPFIQQYLKGRDSLILQEQKQQHDFNLRRAQTAVAVRAGKIVSQIRDRESAQFLSSSAQALPFVDREYIQRSDLWKIVQRMPKGSLLNASIHSFIDIDKLVDLILSTAGLHISAPRPLSSFAVRQDSLVAFQYASASTEQSAEDKGATIWSDDYLPSRLVSVQQAASSCPDGGEVGFRTWLKRNLTGGANDEQLQQNSGRSAAAPIINSLLSYEPILRACLRTVFANLAANGVDYAEFRHNFSHPYRREGNKSPDEDQSEWCHVFEQELQRFQKTEEGRGFHGARIIWTANRSLSNRDLADNMQTCIFAKYDYPGVICGFDLAEMDRDARPLSDLVPVLFWFRKECMDAGLEIPFLFHAGEMSGSEKGHANQGLFDAILLGTRRICEGSTLYKHPLLIELVKEKKILVEFNPSLPSSTPILSALLSRGVPVALCDSNTPDRDQRGANGFTRELWRVLLHGDDHTDLAGLTMLVENSIRWSCYDDQPTAEWLSDIGDGILGDKVKARRLQEWWARFEQFCEWVTETFGAEEGTESQSVIEPM